MSAVAEPPVTDTPPPVARPRLDVWADFLRAMWPGDSFVLNGVTWEEYERLMEFRDVNRPGVRIRFHHGRMVVVSYLSPHESWKDLLAQLLTALAMGLRSPCLGVGNVTIRRESLQTGIEPDDCYYVQTAALVRALRRRPLDFNTDPPPDLAIEIEMTRDAADKLPLYAALGVPEVWRWDGERLLFLHRQPAGHYTPATASRAFPALTPERLLSYLVRSETVDETTLCLELFAWADAARTATPGTA